MLKSNEGMRFYLVFILICIMVWLSTFIHGCKSKGKKVVVKPRTTTSSSTAAISSSSMTMSNGSSNIMSSIAEDEKNEDDETEEDIDEEDFQLICDGHVPLERVKSTPSAIIMGAKKGGTRALIEFVKLHSKVKAAGPEIHYFDRHYDKGLEWYISKMKGIVPDSGEIAIEKTPGYFHTPEAPNRVHDMDPNVKLLLILRDPVKRLISDYNQFRSRHLSQGKNYPTIEELIFTRENEINTEYPVLQRSIYHLHMSRWLMHFPLSQIHIVHGEKFIETPWEELSKVEKFLNLTSEITENNFFFNASKRFYCAREVRTRGVWQCTREKCLSKAKGRPKPPISQGTLERLASFFMPHNKMFYDLVNRDFGWPASS